MEERDIDGEQHTDKLGLENKSFQTVTVTDSVLWLTILKCWKNKK